MIENVVFSLLNVVFGIGFSFDKMFQVCIFFYVDVYCYCLGIYYEVFFVNVLKNSKVNYYYKDGVMCFFINDFGNFDVYYEFN